jgi:hypothetical protein
MKFFSLVTTLLTLGLLAPAGAAYAFVDIDSIIEAAKAGNGTYVESHSSASTGGQTAANGQSVTTGDVSASSHTETRINAGNNGGSVQVKVETSKNGETKTEEYSNPIEKGESVKVEVSARATDEESSAEIKVNGEGVDANEETTTTEDESVTFESKVKLLFSTSIPNVFKKAVSFLWPF